MRRLSQNRDTAYAELRNRLCAGEYLPGERLTEVTLAEDLGMSRTPVREAIHRLQAEGLVVPAGRGVAVAALMPDELANFYRLRSSLESLATELAAERQRDGYLSRMQLERLEELALAVEQAADAQEARATVRSDLAFHRYIGELGANEFVGDALQRIADRLAISFVSSGPDRTWANRAVAEHRGILAAIREGDPPLAARLAREHVEHAVRVATPAAPVQA
jgi:DNA-binding GntR family transcriptional regulator